MQQMTIPSPTENLTVVMGNIPNASSVDLAKAWISKACNEFGAYNGMMFAKCFSVAQDQLITAVRQASLGMSAKPWAKIDLPMDRRTAESALFAIKRMLLSWEYTNKEVHVYTEMGILKVADEEVVKAEVSDFTLKIHWCSGEWEEWENSIALRISPLGAKARKVKGSTKQGSTWTIRCKTLLQARVAKGIY